MARFGRISALILPAIAGALLVASPAAAQFTPGGQFLKAVKEGDAETMIKLLQQHTTSIVNAQDLATGESGLHQLIRKRNITWMEFLLQQGANPNISDKKGVTPLALACQMGLVDAAEKLIAYKARVDIPNSTGETPLIAAVHRRDVPMMRVLLKGGADPDRADSSGRSARDYALYDGPNSQLVSEIEKNQKPANQREGAATYGPSF